jgi:hypothetical protein
MSAASPIRHISDTALWVAVYRAQESDRSDAVFRDPYARSLAGDRGMQIAATMPFGQRHSWSYIARTWLVDQSCDHIPVVAAGDEQFAFALHASILPRPAPASSTDSKLHHYRSRISFDDGCFREYSQTPVGVKQW